MANTALAEVSKSELLDRWASTKSRLKHYRERAKASTQDMMQLGAGGGVGYGLGYLRGSGRGTIAGMDVELAAAGVGTIVGFMATDEDQKRLATNLGSHAFACWAYTKGAQKGQQAAQKKAA